MIVSLERLQHADINLLRELRNADAEAFFDTRQITAKMQEAWWKRYEHSITTRFYTIYLNGVTPVGFLSARVIRTVTLGRLTLYATEVGNLLLAPAFRGQGIMHAALTELRRLHSPFTLWVAHVKSTNAPSLKLFAAHEFIQYDLTPTPRQRKAPILEAR